MLRINKGSSKFVFKILQLLSVSFSHFIIPGLRFYTFNSSLGTWLLLPPCLVSLFLIG